MTINLLGLSLPVANPAIGKDPQHKVSTLHDHSLRDPENYCEEEEFHRFPTLFVSVGHADRQLAFLPVQLLAAGMKPLVAA